MNFNHRDLISVLYIPATHKKALQKLNQLPVKTVIIDLEASLAEEEKKEAAQNLVDAIKSGKFKNKKTMIRLNAIGSKWFDREISQFKNLEIEAILIPRILDAESLLRYQDCFPLKPDTKRVGKTLSPELWVMIETAKSVLNIKEIAACCERMNLRGFVFGSNDFVKDVGCEWTKERTYLRFYLMQSVLAAKAYGLKILDGVVNSPTDEEGLKEEARQAVAMGFDGKTAIHPKQIPVIEAMFSAGEEEIQQAEELIEQAEKSDQPVFLWRGEMREPLHVEQAREFVKKHKPK